MIKKCITKKEDVNRKWYVANADGRTLGRFVSKISFILQGKHKSTYTSNIDTGDFVIVINADKIKLTGNKLLNKMYYRHSLYPSGLKTMNYAKFLKEKPEKVIEKAAKGMLPKTRLGNKMFKKLKVYRGDKHPHQAQLPEELKI
ncbi:MAG: 50S ribosomal protein L13 [candidate division WS2 bacterium]|nr:50S ribosomal protein L13 [Candidatus Lithacetigena glycinireducens]